MARSPLRRRVAVFACLLAPITLELAAEASAVTWTPVPSGTTSEITAIEYRSPTQLWFTTANGGIFKRQADGSFQQTRADSAQRLNDIEFNPSGTIGLAVGAGGQVLRSINGGDSWSAVTGIKLAKAGGGCSGADEPLGDVNHVRFATDERVWIMGQGSQLGLSNSGGTTWVNANRFNQPPDGNLDNDECRLKGDFYSYDGISDGYFPTADAGYVTVGYSRVLFSGSTVDSTTSFIQKPAGATYSGGDQTTLAGGDAGNAGRMWAVGKATTGGLNYTGYTEDGWQTRKDWVIANPSARSAPQAGPSDVDFAGGTVLSAGDGGFILASTDGVDFSYVDAPAFSTASWRSVGLASATQGAVGGTSGTLLLTDDANALPAPVTSTPPVTKPPVTSPPQVQPVPPAQAQATLPSSSRPPITGKAAKIVGKYVVFKVKGKLGIPTGVSRAAACKGTMSLSVYKGKKRLLRKTTKLSSKCGYAKTLKVKRSKVGKSKKLKLKVAFGGNAALRKLSSTYTVKVKR